MNHIRLAAIAPRVPPVSAPTLPLQVAEAVGSAATPLSHLLRLMAAVDAEGGDESLKRLLRARIGAPLDA